MSSELRNQIEAVYREAMRLDPQERATFVETTCAGNDELRHGVQSLLTQDEHRTQPTPPELSDVPTRDLNPSRNQWPGGPHLGHYQILSQIGKGAMGVVYLGYDPRLHRKTALKLLPSEYTQDRARLKRFEREARAASALNHPNVITVYEVGEANGINFIATEFIEGNTLRRIMATEQHELSEKLKVGAQIAAALDSTHRAKVVHRDIKPENIMVRPDGLVKVLDFGLARLTPDRGSSDDSQGNVMAETQGGMQPGTPRYMSPEQVKGLDLDSRTDIFSLGVVLYEWLAGHAPFASEKPEELFDSICHEDPAPISSFQSVPAEVEAIVRKALAKNPHDRFQTAGEIQKQLESVRLKMELGSEDVGFWKKHAGKIALVSALVLAAFVWWWATRQAAVRPSPTVTRLANLEVSDGAASFSPDGQSIAYSLIIGDEQRLFIRRVDSEMADPVTDGTSADRNPIWSADGSRLAYLSNRGGRYGVWVVSAHGGQPELMKEIDIGKVNLIKWSTKRRDIYYEISPNLFVLDIATGSTRQLTYFEPKHSARSYSVSPDETEVAFTAFMDRTSRILVMPIAGGIPAKVTPDGGEHERSPNWLPDGRTLVYGLRVKNSYQVFTIDLRKRKPVQITIGDSTYESVAVSPDGRRILALSPKDNANVFYVDLASKEELEVTTEFGLQLFPELSPDGRKLLVQAQDSSMQSEGSIVVQDLQPRRQPHTVVTAAHDAAWGGDSDTLAFLRGPADSPQLWVTKASGGAPRMLAEGPLQISGWTGPGRNRITSVLGWSPDGRKIAYCVEKRGARNLRVVALDGASDTVLTEVNDESLKITSPVWAPDGTRIAYQLEPFSYSRSGKRRIAVIGTGEKRDGDVVYEHDDRQRLLGWSPSGRELFMARGDRSEATPPQTVRLVQLSLDDKKETIIDTIEAGYLHSVRLSGDAQRIALTVRQDGSDDLKVISTKGGPLLTVTSNPDPTAYFSGLTWSPDGKRLYFSKQTSWSVATVIENFR